MSTSLKVHISCVPRPFLRQHEGGAWDGQLQVQSLGAQQWGSLLVAFTNAQSLSPEKWAVISGAVIRFGVHVLAVCETWDVRGKQFNPRILGYKRLSSKVQQPGRGMMFWLKSDTCTGTEIILDTRHAAVVRCKVGGGK